jgi:hypothetical protein
MAEVCPSCQNSAALTDRFCEHCGRLLAGQSVPADSGSFTSGPALSPPSRSGRGPIVGSLAAVVLLSAGAGVIAGLHGGSPTPLPAPSVSTLAPQALPPSAPIQTSTSPPPIQPSASELAELRELDHAVQLSERARSSTEAAVAGAGDCQLRPADAIATMNQAIATRKTAISQAQGTTTQGIPNGSAMLADLLEALRYSIAADRAYIGWMDEIAAGGSCPVSTANDLSYQAGDQESGTAVAAKKEVRSPVESGGQLIWPAHLHPSRHLAPAATAAAR